MKQPVVVAWLAGELIAHFEPAERGDDAAMLCTAFQRAKAKNEMPAVRSVRVADRATADAITKLVPASVRVRVGTVSEIDRVFDEFLASQRSERELDELARPLFALADRDPARAMRFMAACAALYRASPWRVFEYDVVVQLRCESLGWADLTLSVVGQQGISYGLVLFESFDDFEAFTDADVPPESGAHYWGLTFDALASYSPAVQERFRRERWPLAGPVAVPTMFVHVREGSESPVSPEAFDTMTLAVEALVKFLDNFRAAIEETPDCLVSSQVELPSDRGSVRVRIRYPHPARAADHIMATSEEHRTVEAMSEWVDTFAASHPGDIRRAYEDVLIGYLGRKPTSRDALPANFRTSLGVVWGSLWRPLKKGGTGLEAMRRRRSDDVTWQRVVSRFERARILFGDVLAIDLETSGVRLRDRIRGEDYVLVGLDRNVVESTSRWCRFLIIAIPREDGRWTYTSAALGGEPLTELSWEDLRAETVKALRAAGKPADDGEGDVNAWLLRHAGFVFGVARRWSERVSARAERRRYLENSDHERVAFHEAELGFDGPPAKVIDALDRASDFEPFETGNETREWTWIAERRKAPTGGDESFASVVLDDDSLTLSTNSEGRHRRALERLETVIGGKLEVLNVRVSEPWKNDPSVAPERGEDVDILVIATSAHVVPPGEAPPSPHEGFLSVMRASLDKEGPQFGGMSPRNAAKHPEHKRAVEEWLRGAELRGVQGRRPVFLDLDDLRDELGLERIVPPDARSNAETESSRR